MSVCTIPVEGLVVAEWVARGGAVDEAEIHLELPANGLHKREVVEEHCGQTRNCTATRKLTITYLRRDGEKITSEVKI